MSNNEIHIESFENKIKEDIFSELSAVCSSLASYISEIERTANLRISGERCINLETNLPNVGITLHNKLVELSHQFEKAGLSIFSENLKTFLGYEDFPIVGNAILIELLSYFSKATACLEAYSQESEMLVTKKDAEASKKGPLYQYYTKIRSFFIPQEQEPPLFTTEETEALNTPLKEYKCIDNKLWNFTLENNFVDSLVHYINLAKYHPFDMPILLKNYVNIYLEKLELTHLIPSLQVAITEMYKQEFIRLIGPDIDLKTLALFLPNFDEEKPQETSSLGEPGLSVTPEDIAEIDETVSAADRASAIGAIKKELSTNKDLEGHPKSSDDYSL